ncbi:PREDICTED: alpha-soluble NSF attachment protein-like [Priapulus caudatus]|uniref:Alpha-soluble NSF attachment protein-like n=1 Tax=Priapulus caudatus TaxID=37621 RepID=A0ABM1EWV9_PRICU|nr:PREDICTED: alpha-soluble NSF attachment protein-like [Priapulus caudatus]
MADINEQKAMQLIAEAQKKSKGSSGLFGSFFGSGSGKQEEAAELYIRAANMFKMAKKWSAAGTAFCDAAEIHLKMQSKHEAAQNYVDASTSFKKSDPEEAVRTLSKGIEIFTDMGRFTIAAKHHITMAEIYESDIVDLEKAMQNYQKAADYYAGEESKSSANKCLLKVAQYAAQLGQFEKAIEIYEKVAAGAIDSTLMKYSAKEYFFKAMLCHMCIDVLNAQHALKKYEEMFPAFQDAREYKLVSKLLVAMEEEKH